MSSLLTTGVAVYSLPSIDFDADRFISQQQEFHDVTKPLRISNRGLMGTPSSQHCLEIRRVRHQIYDLLRPELERVFPNQYVQFIIDRVSVRYPNTTSSGEDWHRDTSDCFSRDSKDNNQHRIFGGWFNLNVIKNRDNIQYFTHVPYTWNDAPPSGQHGFDRISKEDQVIYKARQQTCSIPPLHGVMFDENTVHNVAPDRRSKHSSPTWRVHIKVKVSTNDDTTFGQHLILERLAHQAVMPLNLTDECPMYDTRHLMFWAPKIVEFSTNVKDAFLEDYKGNQDNQKKVKRFLPSLLEASQHDESIVMHPPYTNRELSHLIPSKMNHTTMTEPVVVEKDPIVVHQKEQTEEDDDYVYFVKRQRCAEYECVA